MAFYGFYTVFKGVYGCLDCLLCFAWITGSVMLLSSFAWFAFCLVCCIVDFYTVGFSCWLLVYTMWCFCFVLLVELLVGCCCSIR